MQGNYLQSSIDAHTVTSCKCISTMQDDKREKYDLLDSGCDIVFMRQSGNRNTSHSSSGLAPV